MRYMTLATLIAGISGFVVIIVAARAFGDNTALAEEFTAFWGFFFAGTGILTGLTQETTRAVTRGHASPELGTTRTAAIPLKLAGGIAAVSVLVILLSSPLWLTTVLDSYRPAGVWLLALGLGSYSIQACIAGILSGNELWRQYAGMITLDTASRMVVAVIAWFAGWQLLAFLVITVMGAVSWLVLIACSAPLRAALFSHADVTTPQFLRRAGTAMAASGATAVLITGFPTIVRFTHPETQDVAITAAAIIYAVVLTRAPLLVPLQQLQSALIVRFVETRHISALAKPLGLVWAVGIVGAALAWIIGPWLMVTILGPSYAVPGYLLALLTLGAACTASLMVTSAATIAIDRHGVYLAGWIVATIVAVAALAVSPSLAQGAWLALISGPLLGLSVHGYGMKAALRG